MNLDIILVTMVSVIMTKYLNNVNKAAVSA